MVEINKELSMRKIDTEHFILNRATSTFHSFNRSGTYLWEHIQKGFSFEELVDKLVNRFEVSRELAEKDTFEFLMTLQDQHIIKVISPLNGEKDKSRDKNDR
jgi:hypothetical protein